MTEATLGFLDPPSTRYAMAVTECFRETLGGNLTGVYLYGSGTVGDFIPGQSDVDLVVVAGRSLEPDAAQRMSLALWEVPVPDQAKGLDLHLVSVDSATIPRPIPPFELQMLTFAGMERFGGPQMGEPRLNMHYVCCRRHGMALEGPAPAKIFAPFARSWYLEQLHDELFRSMSRRPHYRILNACRDWRFLDENLICSKIAGGRWARERLEEPWIVDAALQWQTTGSGPVIDRVLTDRFIGRVAEMLRRQRAFGHVANGAGNSDPAPMPARRDPSALEPPDGYPGPPAEAPRVTCLLLVRRDTQGIGRALGEFRAQDYPNVELLVGSESPWPLGDATGDPSVTWVRVDDTPEREADDLQRMGVAASGSMIFVWDVDASYPPWRISWQVASLLACGREVSGCASVLLLDRKAHDTSLYDCPQDEGASPTLALATVGATRRFWIRNGVASSARYENGIWLWRAPSATSVDVPPGGYVCALDKPASDEAGESNAQDGPDGPSTPAAETPPAPWPRRRKARPSSRTAMVSCIMPTFNRRAFADQAVRYFLRQEYPNRELIVVDDGSEPVGSDLPMDPRIRYVHLRTRATIGAKRNIACRLASGDVLAQWDDDDWYGPDRIDAQVEDLITGQLDVTGVMRGSCILDLTTAEFWRLSDALLAPRRFAPVNTIAGGTLAFTKDIWGRAGGYPDRSDGEDMEFLLRTLEHGGRAGTVDNDGIYVYVRHQTNSWRLDFGLSEGPAGWRRVMEPDFMPPDDLAFYRRMQAASHAG